MGTHTCKEPCLTLEMFLLPYPHPNGSFGPVTDLRVVNGYAMGPFQEKQGSGPDGKSIHSRHGL